MDEDLKKSSKCKTFSSKSNFFRDITKKYSYRPSCKFCCQKHYYDNHKNYNKKNRSKINAYERQKRKTDLLHKKKNKFSIQISEY